MNVAQIMIETSVKTVREYVMQCRAHDREDCSGCLKPVQKFHTMLSYEVTRECGSKLPVIADACQLHKERMTVCIGMTVNQSVSVLRDTSCCTVIVCMSDLVNDAQMTGRTEICTLIDGTVRRVPVAEIEIETPYYTEQVKTVCMKNPLYDSVFKVF